MTAHLTPQGARLSHAVDQATAGWPDRSQGVKPPLAGMAQSESLAPRLVDEAPPRFLEGSRRRTEALRALRAPCLASRAGARRGAPIPLVEAHAQTRWFVWAQLFATRIALVCSVLCVFVFACNCLSFLFWFALRCCALLYFVCVLCPVLALSEREDQKQDTQLTENKAKQSNSNNYKQMQAKTRAQTQNRRNTRTQRAAKGCPHQPPSSWPTD